MQEKIQLTETWFIYLAMCNDKTLYCGITNNIIKRFWQHNGLKKGGAKYTKARRPVMLVSSYEVSTKSEALKLECTIKKLPKSQKLSYITQLIYGSKT